MNDINKNFRAIGEIEFKGNSVDKLKHLFSAKEASEYLDLSPKTLANSRSSGTGVIINFIKVGGSIKYRKTELDKYLESNTYKHTGEIKGCK